MLHSLVPSPLGEILLTGDGHALTGLYNPDQAWPAVLGHRSDADFTAAREQLAEYFAGDRTRFELQLGLAGTPFQLRVWRALLEIPHGETRTYASIAADLGNPRASRAVGLANGRNPISIIVPCHRLVGSNGSLTGYAGGLPAKRWLLDLEGGLPTPRGVDAATSRR